jgi:hypothetical protein
LFIESQTTAPFTSPARILSQAELFDEKGIHRLLQLDRNQTCVAMGHGAEGSSAIVCGASTPTAMTAIVCFKHRAGIHAFAGKT